MVVLVFWISAPRLAVGDWEKLFSRSNLERFDWESHSYRIDHFRLRPAVVDVEMRLHRSRYKYCRLHRMHLSRGVAARMMRKHGADLEIDEIANARSSNIFLYSLL